MDISKIINTPSAPYYAVIFSSINKMREEGDYQKTMERMLELAKGLEGLIGIESADQDNGFGITISYWESLEAIENWKQNAEHIQAKTKGRELWYEQYSLRICKVEREVRESGQKTVSSGQ